MSAARARVSTVADTTTRRVTIDRRLAYNLAMGAHIRRQYALAGLCVTLVSTLASPPAEACGPGKPASTAAFPNSSTPNVSTATSLVVFASAQPSALKLLANGQDVPLSLATSLGDGVDATGSHGGYWQIRAATANSMLVPGAEHVLSQTMSDGSVVEVARFSTGAGYDKAQGVAPVLRGVRLWRVRYPIADIASGNCVFAEYHGFITVDFDAASVPNTPATSIIYTFHLSPKYGGSEQTFVYTGDSPFVGLEPTSAYPLPTGQWQPELDPTRSYCLTVSAFGDGDLARPALASETLCSAVTQLSAAGAPPPPQIGGGGSSSGGGGCAIATTSRSPSLVWWTVFAVALWRRYRSRPARPPGKPNFQS